ncbi:putative LMBR1 domain protein [Aspergillus homomorphus CBS 101889]|uniref:Probable lysosomal cobalamin transporter n=1 Tax=Aspergillus homomorphus (strain CBS 101889) TaxID=1450537 RepID=A0A395HKU8_ASPHC|nr:putative lysosomal cobalamin transporter [Aspergillus homomorphus CBS 101889]RAL07488.1 putative lysosomal cobalamin transporter [Aspergillus homomorphus CBS 101889]
MAPLQVTLIWVIYVIVIAVAILIASFLIHAYQTPRDRSQAVTFTCILTITSLLATVLLLPVDIALVSSATPSTLGQRDSWATREDVDKVLFSLTTVYYLLYSIDATLCLLVIPFVYFWYEEYDEVATEAGEQSSARRHWAAFKYTISFIAIVAVLLLAGSLIPLPNTDHVKETEHLAESLVRNRGERALTFLVGVLMTVGVPLYILYTSTGLALLPLLVIKAAPNETWKAAIDVQLESNKERQRQLDRRCGGNPELLPSKDRRELDALVREERTLIRRQRLADEAHTEEIRWIGTVWLKTKAKLRPLRVLGGIVLFLTAILTLASMLSTDIDKATNSLCKHRCGYSIKNMHIFNPIDWLLAQSARAFPMDYIMFMILTSFLFCSSAFGIATIGIRFLWMTIHQIRRGHTPPQALLLTTAVLMLTVLTLIYSLSTNVASQYATFGSQTFCDRPASSEGQSTCSDSKHLIKRCSDAADNIAAKRICTPSVASTFINQVITKFPFFGVILFWSQFIFIGVYVLVLVTSSVRSPQQDKSFIDEDAEDAEEESLLASTGRRGDAGLNDIVRRMDRQSDITSVR